MEDHDLLEFEKLKDEQIGRLTYRDTLFYFTMTIIGGALAIACSDKDKQAAEILLILPFAVFIAGVAHITCDRRIEDIGIYIRDELAFSVARKSNSAPESVFAWEQFFRTARFHHWRKWLQFIANEMLYSISGVGALFYFLLRKGLNEHKQVTTAFNLPASEMWLWWVGLSLMVLMCLLIIIFHFMKWKLRAHGLGTERRAMPLVRLIVLPFFVGGTAASVIIGAKYVPHEILVWLGVPTIPLQLTYFVAAVVAMIVGVFVLLVGRRD